MQWSQNTYGPGLVLLSWPVNKDPGGNFTLESSTDFMNWGSGDRIFAFGVGGGQNWLLVIRSGCLRFYRFRFGP